MKILSSLLIGLIFGVGLAVSQMINPAKVVGFLDIFGAWDPTLALVMGSALAFAAPGFYVARRRQKSLLGEDLTLPTRTDIDTKLLGGAVIFGIGWGLAGLCPGPAIAVLAIGPAPVFGFLAAMIAGMALYRIIFRN